ncbi:MAG: hypothetical protein AAGE89_05035 [Pseudomonadota bacterium]
MTRHFKGFLARLAIVLFYWVLGLMILIIFVRIINALNGTPEDQPLWVYGLGVAGIGLFLLKRALRDWHLMTRDEVRSRNFGWLLFRLLLVPPLLIPVITGDTYSEIYGILRYIMLGLAHVVPLGLVASVSFLVRGRVW